MTATIPPRPQHDPSGAQHTGTPLLERPARPGLPKAGLAAVAVVGLLAGGLVGAGISKATVTEVAPEACLQAMGRTDETMSLHTALLGHLEGGLSANERYGTGFLDVTWERLDRDTEQLQAAIAPYEAARDECNQHAGAGSR